MNTHKYIPGDQVIYNRRRYHVIRRSKIALGAIRISEKPNARDDESILVSEKDVRQSIMPGEKKHGI